MNWSWSTFWQAVAALAALIVAGIAAFEIYRRVRRPKKYRLFLSMQMSGLKGDDYVRMRRDIMQVIYELRKSYSVYFYNEYVQNIEAFDESSFDVKKYLDKIDKCDFFIAVISENVLSSIYLEVAYAFAKGKKAIYFLSDESVMPLVMRKLARSRPEIKVFNETQLPRIHAIIKEFLVSSR